MNSEGLNLNVEFLRELTLPFHPTSRVSRRKTLQETSGAANPEARFNTQMAADERSPLLLLRDGAQKQKCVTKAAKAVFSPANAILLAGFLMSFTLGITQVPIVYVFRLMECDVFYQHHPPFEGPGDRCSQREINAGTAQQVAILGMSTSFSGVFNLFVCGYLIKVWDSRWAFVSQTSLLGLRVATQCIGVTMGGRAGIIFFQAFQSIGIIGGPRGYMLVLNTAISEVVAPRDRTAVFGRLQGTTTLGTAIGYLLGGVLGDVYTIRRPFEVAFFCFIGCSLYGALFMPTSTSEDDVQSKSSGKEKADFFAPLKIIVPHKYLLPNGRIIKNYGLIFLASGIFLGVLATGYAPTLLQMYATSEFNFSTTENGWLMAGNAFIRGLFLYFMFPKIITAGRLWYNGSAEESSQKSEEDTDIPTRPGEFGAAPGHEVAQQPAAVPAQDTDEEDKGTQFGLFFLRYSLLIDAAVTTLAGFSSKGWQVHLAAYLLPFTSGSAPAAKGVMTEMCPPEKRRDAIASITLVESASMLITQGCFGYIFSFFAGIGHTSLTFFCNAALAFLGVIVLNVATYPPPDAKLITNKDEEDEEEECLLPPH